MRIIAGEYRGRRLKSLKGDQTRPTTDKIKEALFNMIGPYFDGGTALDLYGGSGGLVIEAVSRGIDHGFCVEKNFQALKIIQENIAVTKEESKFTLLKKDADQALQQFTVEDRIFDLVFLDPPYAAQKIESQLTFMSGQQLLTQNAVIVCETQKEVSLPERINDLIRSKQQTYGITAITIYRKEGSL